MDRLDQYRVFVQVAEMRSFIKAANALELPRASVSAAILELEASIGSRLLHRTTRTVRLTTDGAQFLDRVKEFLADAEDLEQTFQARQSTVSGRLNVDVPSRIARRLIVPALPRFLQRHPGLQLALRSNDRSIDLVREGVDCVVRVGRLGDSSLAARPIGQLELINCASPGYLKTHGTPRTVDDLLDKQHCVVGYANPADGREIPWEYVEADETRQIELPSRVVVNNVETYIACCLAGMGLIQIPRYDVQHHLERGELVSVLAEQPAPTMSVSFLYAHRNQRSRRLLTFMEWFEELIAPHLVRSANPPQI